MRLPDKIKIKFKKKCTSNFVQAAVMLVPPHRHHCLVTDLSSSVASVLLPVTEGPALHCDKEPAAVACIMLMTQLISQYCP